MGHKRAACRGCFLGLAIGDAMGYTVDEKTWEEICESYGPNGLLGYDLTNSCAEVTSYTQVAAYVANALLLGVSRSKPGMYLTYIAQAMRQWAKRQHFPRDPEKNLFWVSQVPELRRKNCRDARMLDAMRFETLGTPEKPINAASTPGALLTGAVIGLFYDERRLEPAQIGTLTAQAVSLTHGDPESWLSAVTLAYVIAGLMQEPERSLKEQFLQAAEVMDRQFRDRFPSASQLSAKLKVAMGLAGNRDLEPREGMEQLVCSTAGECLAGAMFACLVSKEDFDEAMIAAVNHSGRSAAVGAITGAILGTRLTDEALPEFYLESLEAAPALGLLAEDLAVGSPAAGLFDDDWDHKYVQGLPLI